MIGVVILMTFEMVIAEHDSTFPSFAVICLLHIALIFLLSVLMVVGRRCVVESFFSPPTTFLWKRLDVDLQVADELLVTQLELILIIKATERLRFTRALVIRLVRAR